MTRSFTTMLRTAVAVVVGGAAAISVTQMWPAQAAPGDNDATYVPVVPCRLFDYRPAPDTVGSRTTPLAAGQPHTQQVTGNVGNCTGAGAVPAGAKAVALNVTAISPTAQSNLRLYPADAGVPLVSNLNFSAGQKPVANKVDVKVSPDGKIKLLNHAGTVFVAGDVVGYYTSDTLTAIDDRLAALEAQVTTLADANTTLEGAVDDLRTQTQVFSAYALEPVNAESHVVLDSDECVYLADANTPGALALDLPVGATIDSVTADIIDGSGNGLPVNPGLALARVTPNTIDDVYDILTLTTSDTVDETRLTVDLTPATPQTVDPGESFFVTFRGGANVGQNSLCGVTVTTTRPA